MKRLVVRISALATVVMLGLIAIAQAQRGADQAPRQFSQVGRVNPLRPEPPPAAASDQGEHASRTNLRSVPAVTVQAAGTQDQPSSAAVQPLASAEAPPSGRAPAVDPFALGGATNVSGMPSMVPSGQMDPPGAPPAAISERYSSPPSQPSAAESPAGGGIVGPSMSSRRSPPESMPSLDTQPTSAPLLGDQYTGPQSGSAPTREPTPFRLDPAAPAGNIPPAASTGAFSTAPMSGMPRPVGSSVARTNQRLSGGMSDEASGEGTGTPGAQSLEGSQTPQLTLEKVAPAEIQVGKAAVFQIKLRNTGAVAAHDVEIHDEVPRGTRLLSTNPRASLDAGGELVWQLGTVKPGDEMTAEVELMPTDEGEIGSVASVHFAAQASVRTLATKPELVVEAAAPGEVLLGKEATLTITVSNPGSGVATGVVLEERVPPGLQHPAGTELEYEVGDLKPKETRQLQLVLTAQQPGPATNVLVAQGDGNLKAENQLVMNVTAPQLDVSVDGPKRRYLEREATYELSIGNAGTAPARNVLLVANLPSGMQFVSANNAGTYDEAKRCVQWQLEELPQQEHGSVLLTAMPVEMGEQVIQVRASSEMGLAVQKELPVVVEGIAAILFEVVDVNDPIEVGGETTYEIRVLNQGSKAATNVQLAVLLPPEMRAVAAEGPARYTVEPNRVLFEGLSRLAPKADTTYRVRVQGLQPGDLRIRVQLTTDEIRTPVTKEESTRVYSDQ